MTCDKLCRQCKHNCKGIFGWFTEYFDKCKLVGHYSDIERSLEFKRISKCGPDGLLWEPKLSLMEGLRKLFKRGR